MLKTNARSGGDSLNASSLSKHFKLTIMSEEFEKNYQEVIKAELCLTISYIAFTVYVVFMACIWANIYF